MFEFQLSVTKECVFYSPTPAPPETAAGSQKKSILWCIFQLLPLANPILTTPPFFFFFCSNYFSLFPHVLQWQLCSRDTDPGKCFTRELLRRWGSFFILNKFQLLPWSMTWAWAMWYHTSEVNKGVQRGELSLIYPGEPHREFECIWPLVSEGARDESWFRQILTHRNKPHAAPAHPILWIRNYVSPCEDSFFFFF